MRNRKIWAGVSAALFVTLVVASNWLTARYGLVAGFVTAGTFTAGLVLAVRDAVRETGGLLAAYGCVAAGAALSAWLATPALALASAAAFAVAETLDSLVYEPLRRRGRVRALAASNLVGSIADTVVFLLLAGFPLWPAAAGQVAVKVTLSVLVAAPLVMVSGALLRHRVRPVGA
jgi:uncharacterized PurR-regulated membrane protein YhhQ (DUF165 family)